MVKSNHFNEQSQPALDAVCDLIQSAKEECTILRSSAGACSDAQLNELLIELSNERGCFAFELEGYVERHGVSPAGIVPLRSPFRRAIQQLQALMRKGDTQALLKECEHHEDHMLQEYGRVMSQSAPEDAWPILKRQYERVRISRRQLRHWLEHGNRGPLTC